MSKINKKKGTVQGAIFTPIILYYFLMVFVFGCSSPLKSRPVFKSKGRIEGIYHKVRKGETLWRIAKTYNVGLKKIIKINNISNVRKIKAGSYLFIPGAKKRLQLKTYKPSFKKASLQRKHPLIKKGFFAWPLRGTLTSYYGIRKKQSHDGIDIAAPEGTPIFAAASGRVIFSGWGPTGYGKMVIVRHNKKWVTVYAHNSKNRVKKKQRVKKGEKIAYVGSTGRSTGPHLHFELRENREPVNPLNYLK